MLINQKILFFVFSLSLGVMLLAANVPAQHIAPSSRNLDAAVSPKTRGLVEKGVQLAERQDKISEGLALIKQAIAAAPHFVKARVEYVRLKSYWLNEAEETRAEYEELMKKEPENPVYPLALAAGAYFASQKDKQKWFESAARLAPETAWGHYTKARAVERSDAEIALAESLKAVEKDPAEILFYNAAFPLLLKQKKFAEAAAMIEKMKKRPEWRAFALRSGWNLRLAEGGNSDEAKKAINDELESLARHSSDLETLLAVRSRYKALKNEEKLKSVEEKISRLDPSWYAERGEILFTINLLEKVKQSYFAGRQNQIYNKLKKISADLDAKEQIAQAVSLLTPDAGKAVKKLIYNRIFGAAVKAGDTATAIKYGELILASEPEDVSVLTGLAKILAGGKKDLKKALNYSQHALELTEASRFASAANRESSDFMLPEEALKDIRNGQRIQALTSRAFVLAETGDFQNAEIFLNQSLAIKPTAGAYSQLESVLRKQGRNEAAAQAALEGESFWRKEILKNFKNEPSKDFELTTIKGERIKLSALKGKIVMINFWATWCVPCLHEMPILVELYEKYKPQGLEILAVSVDVPEDRPKILPFAAKTRINFPILLDENAASLYAVSSYPTTIFVDREGNLRYRTKGLDVKNARRDFEFIISEILKDKS